MTYCNILMHKYAVIPNLKSMDTVTTYDPDHVIYLSCGAKYASLALNRYHFSAAAS